MSIIHDALKKVQGKLRPDSREQPAQQPPSPSDQPGSIFSSPAKSHTQIDDETPVEYLPSAGKKTDSAANIIFAVGLIAIVFWFLFKQMDTYLPEWQKTVKSLFHKAAHKKEQGADFNYPAKDPKDFVPLAKINVAPAAAPAPASAGVPPAAAPAPAARETPAPPASKSKPPRTLNIHGVMSRGSSHAVLINDEVYQEGDEVDGVKIVKIELNYVTIINNGKEERVKVKN